MKKKNKNPNIICVITYVIITIIYVVFACINIKQGKIFNSILFTCFSAVWGVLTGVWIHRAITYKQKYFLELKNIDLMSRNIELLKTNIELYRENIDLRTELNLKK